MSLTPTSRREQYYDAIANGSTDVPDPISREEKYLKQIAENGGGGGETSQPDFVYGGSCAGIPTQTELTNALSNIVFNSDIDAMCAKVQAKGSLDITGCFATEDQKYYASKIYLSGNVQIIPKEAAIEMGFPVDSDVITLNLTTEQSNYYTFCGICVMNGELVAYPLGGGLKADIAISGSIASSGDFAEKSDYLAATYTPEATLDDMLTKASNCGRLDIGGAISKAHDSLPGVTITWGCKCVCCFVVASQTFASLIAQLGKSDYQEGTDGMLVKVGSPIAGENELASLIIYQSTSGVKGFTTTAF